MNKFLLFLIPFFLFANDTNLSNEESKLVNCYQIFDQRRGELEMKLEQIQEQQQAFQALKDASMNILKKKEAKKRAQEFARYLLPVGMNAHLYHTVNVITALRYINAVKVIPEAKDEAKEFIELIKKEMLNIDKA